MYTALLSSFRTDEAAWGAVKCLQGNSTGPENDPDDWESSSTRSSYRITGHGAAKSKVHHSAWYLSAGRQDWPSVCLPQPAAAAAVSSQGGQTGSIKYPELVRKVLHNEMMQSHSTIAPDSRCVNLKMISTQTRTHLSCIDWDIQLYAGDWRDWTLTWPSVWAFCGQAGLCLTHNIESCVHCITKTHLSAYLIQQPSKCFLFIEYLRRFTVKHQQVTYLNFVSNTLCLWPCVCREWILKLKSSLLQFSFLTADVLLFSK